MKPPRPTRPNPNVPFPPAPGRGEKLLFLAGYLILLAAIVAYFGGPIWVAFQ